MYESSVIYIESWNNGILNNEIHHAALYGIHFISSIFVVQMVAKCRSFEI